jgi:hypothetical protein
VQQRIEQCADGQLGGGHEVVDAHCALAPPNAAQTRTRIGEFPRQQRACMGFDSPLAMQRRQLMHGLFQRRDVAGRVEHLTRHGISSVEPSFVGQRIDQVVVSRRQRGGQRERKCRPTPSTLGISTPSHAGGASKPGASQKRRTGATRYKDNQSSSPSAARDRTSSCCSQLSQASIHCAGKRRDAKSPSAGILPNQPAAPVSCAVTGDADIETAPAQAS